MRLSKLTSGNRVGSRVPSRYYVEGYSVPESPTWVEFYPQNCWKHCLKKNLKVTAWNGESSLSQLTNRVNDNEYLKDSGEWIGIESMEALNKLLSVGDMTKPVNLSPTFGTSIVNLSTPQRKRRRKWINEEEGDLMPENYIARDPQLFYAKKRVEGKKHRTNLVIAAGGNSSISPKTIQIRARIYAKIIDELQRQGHNVGVHCVDPIGNHNHSKMHWILWEVKRHDEQMTIPQLQRDLGHSAVYRTAIFDLIAAAPKNPGSGLGYTATGYLKKNEDGQYRSTLKHLIEAIKLELGEPTIILNLLPLDENLKEDKLDNHLQNIKNQLNTLVTQPKRSGVHLINTQSK